MASPIWQEMINIAADGSMMSNRALIEEFVAGSEIAATTAHKYRAHLGEFAEWLDKPLFESRRRDVKRFLAYLKTDGRQAADQAKLAEERKGWRGNLSASTRKGYLAAIRELFRYCADLYDLEHDPTFAIQAPKVSHKPGLTIKKDELRRFLDAPGRERDRVQAYLLVFTAARSGEVGLRAGLVGIGVASRRICSQVAVARRPEAHTRTAAHRLAERVTPPGSPPAPRH